MLPGIHNLTTEEYHGDPCPAPSLSSSIAKIMLEQSPRHAWHAHPRLNPQFEPKQSGKMDAGTVAHELLLGAGRGITVIDAPDWRTKDAKAQRDDARKAGKTPILSGDLRDAEKMVAAARVQIDAAGIADEFATAAEEVALFWQDEGGVWCRGLIDKLFRADRRAVVFDYKTTERSAAPQGLGALIASMGYDLQAGFYARGLGALFPELIGRITFRWIVQEVDPPYGLSIVELDGAGQVMGAKKAAVAVALWRRCLVTGEWPLYPAGVVRADYPSWAETRWLTRETEDPLIRDLIATPMLPEPERAPAEAFTEFMP